MRYSIHLFLLLVALILGGCTSVSTNQSIPLPDSTPFDSNAATRQMYLDAYRDGYRAVAFGGSSTVDSMHGPNQRIKELGWRAGAADAQRQKAESK
jgi:hypothetical protein